MNNLVGTPEGDLLRAVSTQDLRVHSASGEVKRAEARLAQQTDIRERKVGDASVQLILMRNAPNISEGQKLAFATQILRLNGAESLDDQAIMEQFDRFVPGAPIISVAEHPFFARVIMSETSIGIQPNGKSEPGFAVSIGCRTRSINHRVTADSPAKFDEFDTGINITRLSDIVVGLPALQSYIDTFPGAIPTDKKEREAYKKRLTHLFSSFEDMGTLGVDGVDHLNTTRLAMLRDLATKYGNPYEDEGEFVAYRRDSRSGHGWWPRH